jgi:hypothetical protein
MISMSVNTLLVLTVVGVGGIFLLGQVLELCFVTHKIVRSQLHEVLEFRNHLAASSGVVRGHIVNVNLYNCLILGEDLGRF